NAQAQTHPADHMDSIFIALIKGAAFHFIHTFRLPYITPPSSTAAAIPTSMLPAMEKLSSQLTFFTRAKYSNTAMAAALTTATIRGIKLFKRTPSPRYEPI